MKTIKLMILIAVLAISAVSCRGGSGDSAKINIDATVSSTAVGDTMLNVNIVDGNGKPVSDAKLSIKGDMTHAGMEPVLRESASGNNGDYMIPFQWTMGGDWIVTIEAELTDGSVASRDFDFSVDSEMSDMEHGDGEMDHSEMEMDSGS